MPSFWTRLRAFLNPLARENGFYTAYTLSQNEYVGRIHGFDVSDATGFLKQHGYEPQTLSAAKKHPETGQLHDLSYRRVPAKHPELLVHEPLCRTFRPEECQYHVHAWQTGEWMEFFSHYETRPDVFKPSFSLERIRTHYRPTYGTEYFQGITDVDL